MSCSRCRSSAQESFIPINTHQAQIDCQRLNMSRCSEPVCRNNWWHLAQIQSDEVGTRVADHSLNCWRFHYGAINTPCSNEGENTVNYQLSSVKMMRCDNVVTLGLISRESSSLCPKRNKKPPRLYVEDTTHATSATVEIFPLKQSFVFTQNEFSKVLHCLIDTG